MALDLEITGKVLKLLDVQKGESRGKQWQKGGFVLETGGNYPKKVCCVVWGDNLNQVNSLKEGDSIRASIDIESREFNDRWYTDVKAWKFAPVEGGAAGPDTGTTGTPPTTSISYGPPPANGNDQYADIRQDSSSEGEGADDLPF